jgi:hypothetical protein
VALFLNSSYHASSSKDGEKKLLQGHFAVVARDPSPIQLDDVGGRLVMHGANVEWQVATEFPQFENDVLLYLSLMGTSRVGPFYTTDVVFNDFTAFSQDHGRFSFHEAFVIAKHSELAREGEVDTRNALQTSNSSQDYEGIFSGACIVASHYCGYSAEGMRAVDFLCRLAYECSFKNSFPQNIAIPQAISAFLNDIRIPYLSPPDLKFPSFVSAVIPSLGLIKRVENKERNDVLCTSVDGKEFIFSGECKQRSRDLTTDILKSIIVRSRTSVKLQFVLITTVQHTFFNRGQGEAMKKYVGTPEEIEKLEEDDRLKRYANWRKEHNIDDNILFAKLQLDMPFSVEKIPGLPFIDVAKVERLVIILVVGV